MKEELMQKRIESVRKLHQRAAGKCGVKKIKCEGGLRL